MNEYFEKIINEYGFEKREGQEKMAQLIQNCIDENKSCLVEAGTGIGKTLAYLLPSILYSKKNEKRVVISTNTINLQEQIIDKDLPLLEKIIGEKINYRLVKGRGNYVCGNRLINNCTDPSIIDWYKKTKTGDKSEIDFYIDPSVWEQIKSDKDYCINAKCSQTDNCFYYKIKEKIKDCEILIVNHALLLSHFKYDKVLPDFDFLVIDESHNLENIARTYFEDSLSAKDLGLNFGLIYNKRTNKGIFTKLALQIEGIEKIYVDYIDTFNRLYDAFLTYLLKFL
ncbi:ATP-dependent DNA helicase [Sneathia sanguinegens]|uniref:DNA 5'-3' helicase n=1 Tax=Sneathia sanguinegens TaxID=40543 RepID=A0ABT7HLT4_9FUSO|nr:ATP-dependent DNA helicase [Sneathia sanguinegens]MDK9580695.1 ATP-dependent DNA helicase [Sneathia sanguinegens]